MDNSIDCLRTQRMVVSLARQLFTAGYEYGIEKGSKIDPQEECLPSLTTIELNNVMKELGFNTLLPSN